jgi:diguanylate cyclase (GGDEF)-like protein
LGLSLVFLLFSVDLLLVVYELSFSIFYLLPISLASWFVARSAGIAFSILSALLWLVADVGAGAAFTHAHVPYWNTGVRLGFFLVVAFMLAALRMDSRALARAQQREIALVRRDPQTGLRNSSGFNLAAERMLERARRLGQPVALVYLDADDQRSYNGYFGRRAGDTLLTVIADGIRENTRCQDLAARMGGDEFAILLRDADEEVVRKFVASLQETFQHQQLKYGRPVRASVGVVVSRNAPKDLDTLVTRAEQLMYSVKDTGKNNVRIEIADHVSGATAVY